MAFKTIHGFWKNQIAAFGGTAAPKDVVTYWNALVAAITTFATTFVALTGNQTIAGVKTFSSMPIIPVNPDLAAAGTTVTDAAQLLSGFTVVTGANGTVGVKLPATPAPGTVVWIKGTTSGVLKVWPDAAATINAIGSNGALSMTTGVMPLLLIAKSATQWYTLPLVAS